MQCIDVRHKHTTGIDTQHADKIHHQMNKD